MDATVKQINFAKDICVLTKDFISRADATSIPVLPKEHREYPTFNLDDAYEQGWYDLQKCIETLPSAEPQWIPVSERLPIPPTFCLVTTDGSHGDVIDIALYVSDGWHKASEVLAWMPLPPPYEGSETV